MVDFAPIRALKGQAEVTDFSRQDAVKKLEIPSALTVIGTGGLGTWVAYFAALTGVQQLIIYDKGLVTESDLARFPFSPGTVGTPRGEALKKEILRIRPGTIVDLKGPWRSDPTNNILAGPVFNCAAGPNGFDEDIRSRCEIAKTRYVSGAYLGLELFVTGEVGPVFTPQQEPVGTWNAAVATTAALMLTSGLVKPRAFSMSLEDPITSIRRIDHLREGPNDMAR